MAIKVTVNAGHGHKNAGYDPGAINGSFQEATQTKEIALLVESKLKYNGFETLFVQDGDLQDVVTKSNNWNAQYFIAIHTNSSNDKSAHGIETYAVNAGGNGEKIARSVQTELIRVTNLTDRGVKFANFYVIKYTKCPAILIELGFISNDNEMKLMQDSKWDDKVATAIAKGFMSFLEMTYKEQNSIPTPIPSTPSTPSIPPSTQTSKTSILGTETLTVEQCNQYIRKVNPNAIDLAAIYKKYGEMLGIRWGFAFAQMVIESNYLRFGGDVLASQNNFAGIGATGKGAKGAIFATPDEGVLAQLEHLYAYASKQPLPSNLPKVDPRFDLVSRGVATNIEDLGGRWAVPGYERKEYASFEQAYVNNDTYGQHIVQIHDAIAKEVVAQSKPKNPIVVVKNDIDEKIAFYVCWKYLAEMVYEKNLTQSIVDMSDPIYEIGGTKNIAKSIHIAGNDRFDTAFKVIEYIKSN